MIGTVQVDSCEKLKPDPVSIAQSTVSQSENDIPGPATPEPLPSSVITYSEPALCDQDKLEVLDDRKANALVKELASIAECSNLIADSSVEPLGGLASFLNSEQENLLDPVFGSSSNRSMLTSSSGDQPKRPKKGPVVVRSSDHKESVTASDYHSSIRKKHMRKRHRHYTDPVDFEGILNIMGGCGWWQIWVYLLISMQQIPHAMFNLSVMYMMYQPDHWCHIDELSPVFTSAPHDKGSILGANWTKSNLLKSESNIAFPWLKNQQRQQRWHSQCNYYPRSKEEFNQLMRESFADAKNSTKAMKYVKCSSWDYEKDIMSETIVTQWNLVCEKNIHRAHAQMAYSVGFLVGCLISGLSSDRFGRKPTIIGFGVLASMFGIILPYSTYFPMFLLIRFLSAVCNEAADLAAYVLCMEITGTKYRAMVGSFSQAPWAIGYALLAAVAYLTRSWRTMQIITAALHTVTILLICVLPESPRWLIVNNRVREAENIIRKACRMNKSFLPANLELVKHAEQRLWVKRHKRAHFFHLFKSRILLARTGIIYVIWTATALVYYGLVIALADQSGPERSLFSGNYFVNNAVAGAIELPTLLGCVFLLRFGRKRSQMSTLTLAGVMIIISMIVPEKMRVLKLFFMMLGKVFIQAAFNILYIFTSELYPTVIRNIAIGTASMVARFGAGVSSYVAILADFVYFMVPMIIFGVFSLVAAALVVFLPETRDKPLPDTLNDAVSFLNTEGYCGRKEPSLPGEHANPHSDPVSNGPVNVTRTPAEAAKNSSTQSTNDGKGILKEIADLNLPAHPDQLPETCSEGKLSAKQ